MDNQFIPQPPVIIISFKVISLSTCRPLTRKMTAFPPCIPSFPSFSLPDVLCDPTDFIWRKGTPFDAMTGSTATSSDCLLAEVFLSCKANARRSVHGLQDHFIITLIISD